MNRRIHVLAFVAIAAAAGCSDERNRPTDTALNTDLSLAAQQSAYRQLDSVSAVERGLAPAAPAASTPRRTTSTSGGEVATARRRTTRSTGGTTGSVGTTTTQRTTVEKHTHRDAAIGAAAGAVIGATTSRDKVKGAVIGAAVGGILGGVIGNNVDVKKTKKP